MHFVPDQVSGIGPYAFSLCTCLPNCTIPEKVTIIEEGLFSYCESLNLLNSLVMSHHFDHLLLADA